MNIREIEKSVGQIDLSQGFDLVFDLLLAYGIPQSSITRLRKGDYDRMKEVEDSLLWRKKLYYAYFDDPSVDLHLEIDSAQKNEDIERREPRFLIVRNQERLLALDTRTEGTIDIDLAELGQNVAFFMPWAGIEKSVLENVNYADRKAAEKMARLYEEIRRINTIDSDEGVRNLNVFFSRVLFCFFAEDTDVFSEGAFTRLIDSVSRPDASDTSQLISDLFKVLDTPEGERDGVASHFAGFGYVNGSLFSEDWPVPDFSVKARELLLDCGTLDWSEINPDIFGSMIQAVALPESRETLGMHYTSVENIMKVIRPLFLDELEEQFDSAKQAGNGEESKLRALLDRLAEIRVFDPACGSGNFLIIAYKELRRLEHEILERLFELSSGEQISMTHESRIVLKNFFGIEIDDFAHQIAQLSLWLAKHQMNRDFQSRFGTLLPLIPLTDTGEIVCGNATRIDWNEVCPTAEGEVFVLGNPPYLGARMQSAEHKADFVEYFATKRYPRDLDYISLWFLKGADYLSSPASSVTLAFVTTNSISQGAHVGLLWPMMFEKGARILFAYTSFPWQNNARGNAGVTCSIVGLCRQDRAAISRLFGEQSVREVENISPYLVATKNNSIVIRHNEPLSDRPPMVFGSRAIDGKGGLALSRSERDELVGSFPEAEAFIRPFIGASELIKGKERFCIWVEDQDLEAALRIPFFVERFDRVRNYREGSRDKHTKKAAGWSHRFAISSFQNAPQLVVPGVSSEKRRWVPLGLLEAGTVISNLAFAVYDAAPWLFGLLHSRMHMAWLAAVGGRMKTDYRYSNSLVYNTFAFPHLDPGIKQQLTEATFRILDERDAHPEKSLAQLYDSDAMPASLERVHEELDELVDSLYSKRPFGSDSERVEMLLQLYEEATSDS